MNKYKNFIKNNKSYGELKVYEIYYNKNPKVYHLRNEKGDNFIYFQKKSSGLNHAYLLLTSQKEINIFREGNTNFNDAFNGEVKYLRIFRTHTEIFEKSGLTINDITLDPSTYYISTYKNLQDSLSNDKKFRRGKAMVIFSSLLILLAYLSQLIPIKWLSYTISAILILLAFAIIYYVIYKTIIFDDKS